MSRLWLVLGILALSTGTFVATSEQARGAAAQPQWPRTFTAEDGSRLTVHQPQVDSWKDYLTLRIRAAVLIQPKGQTEPTYATIKAVMQTVTNMKERRVTLYNIAVGNAKYTTATGQKVSAAARTTLSSLFPAGPLKLSLDRLLPYTKRPQAPVKKQKLAFDVPTIHVSAQPAILVLLDGEPAMEKVGPAGIMQVVNSTWDLFYELDSKRFYLRSGAHWFDTADLRKGPWAVAKRLPSGLYALPVCKRFEDTRANVPGRQASASETPKIIVDTGAAALVVTDGRPRYSRIPQTTLLYLTNSKSDVFLHGDGKTYLLLGGRWYRAPSLQGPWHALPQGPPREFAKIPPEHPKANAMAAVPGTRQATEAVISAQIPQQAIVEKGTTVQVSYVGDAVFEPVPGTTMRYAVNTSFDVIKVGSTYYACVDGVWFVSGSPNGPFTVATKVHKMVYKIPPSSPKHHVTYVYVYDTSPEVVVVGYVPAYVGAFIWNGMVVWGAGYRYHYARHYHSHYHHHHAYHHGVWHGRYHYGQLAYGHDARYKPRLGGYEQRTAFSGSVNGRPFYGNATRGGNAYSRWGGGTVVGRDRAVQAGRYRKAHGSSAGFPSTTGAKGVAHSGARGKGFVVKGAEGDLHAGRDGKVYRRTASGWKEPSAGHQPLSMRYDSSVRDDGSRGQWADAQVDGRTRRDLDDSHRARQEGNSRAQSHDQPPSGRLKGWGRGGRMGGGGRGRRAGFRP